MEKGEGHLESRQDYALTHTGQGLSYQSSKILLLLFVISSHKKRRLLYSRKEKNTCTKDSKIIHNSYIVYTCIVHVLTASELATMAVIMPVQP